MKKILFYVIITLLFMPIYSFAEVIPHNVYAISHQEYNTEDLKKEKILSFQSLDEYFISDFEVVEKNSILKVKINEYIEPKRGKRDGYIKIQIISYSIPEQNNAVKNIEEKNITGTLRLSTEKDKKELAKHAGIAVVGHILKVPGFSQAVALSKGLIKPNPEQNRLQSAGTNLYESTPLTLSERGNELIIEEDAIVVMKVKQTDKDGN